MVQFKIQRHTLFSKVMQAYYEQQDSSMMQVGVLFHGCPINERDTPHIWEWWMVCASSRQEVSTKR